MIAIKAIILHTSGAQVAARQGSRKWIWIFGSVGSGLVALAILELPGPNRRTVEFEQENVLVYE